MHVCWLVWYFNTKNKLFKSFVPCDSSVNSAFVTLRELIPTEPKNRKLSKIETLRLAKSYIEHLAATLMTGKINHTTHINLFIFKLYCLFSYIAFVAFQAVLYSPACTLVNVEVNRWNVIRLHGIFAHFVLPQEVVHRIKFESFTVSINNETTSATGG